jgi:VIT1/CCC1 family predicted Fe2+/Mn2+ transporter
MPRERDETPSEPEADQTAGSVGERLGSKLADQNLGEFVLGAIDGTITTFAIVAGSVGADLSAGIVVVLGIANLLADGFSMGIGVFLASRAENQRLERTRRAEERHTKQVPEGETEVVRRIFAEKGFEGEELERVVEVITSDRDRWVETMIREEHRLTTEPKRACRAGLVTYLAFVIAGTIPLIPFFVTIAGSKDVSGPFVWSAAFTGLAFFLVGTVKSRFVEGSWLYEGIETLAVGGFAAGVAYGIGYALRGLVDAI